MILLRRAQWADKDASEKARRLHLKHEKSLLGDQAREYGSRLDEIEKRVSPGVPLSHLSSSHLSVLAG